MFPRPSSRRIRRPRRAALALGSLVAALLLPLAGCSRGERGLRPDELTRDEAAYVDRVLILERVRAALLVDDSRGLSQGDSLASAWGDSALPETIDLAPTDPTRAALVHELLLRLLAAEQDSLLARGGLRPLDAPWPVPADSVAGAGFPAASRVRAGD